VKNLFAFTGIGTFLTVIYWKMSFNQCFYLNGCKWFLNLNVCLMEDITESCYTFITDGDIPLIQ